MMWSGPVFGTNWKCKIDETRKQLLHNHQGKDFSPTKIFTYANNL